MCVDVVRLDLQRRFNPGKRVFAATCSEEERGCPELDLDVIGKQVGGAHVRLEGTRGVPCARVRFGEPLVCFPKRRIGLNGVPVLR